MDSQGLVAVIGSIAAGLVLIIGALRAQRRSANAGLTPPTVEQIAEVPEDPVGQREFIALVMADNRDLRTELGHLRRAVEEMRADIESDKSWKAQFLDALGRWLGKIAHDYSSRGTQMPLPDGADLALLQEVVPRG